jgi:hypothetical protein
MRSLVVIAAASNLPTSPTVTIVLDSNPTCAG